MARDFNAGRALSPEAMEVWRVAFEPYIAGTRNVLDVGSGTGRFAGALAGWFNVAVIAVEPARAMRQATVLSARRPKVSYVGGRAERLPLRAGFFDVALLSNVYHHIVNRHASAQELARGLRPGGRVLVRQAFADRLGEITLFEHFPEAKTICEQFPSLADAVGTFASAGFEMESVQRVRQQTCLGLRQLAERTRLRADTTLLLMSDETFAMRQQALKEKAVHEITPSPVIDTLDLLVLGKSAAN